MFALYRQRVIQTIFTFNRNFVNTLRHGGIVAYDSPFKFVTDTVPGPSDSDSVTERDKTHIQSAQKPLLSNDEIFGHYRILKLLGCGGMGEVYECEGLENGPRLALKILRPELVRARDRARFLREGRLAASVNHPNSVYILGTEEIRELPVITMELVSGGSLKAYIDWHGPLSAARAVDIILPLIAGLVPCSCGHSPSRYQTIQLFFRRRRGG
jgi:serine/threonine protein kinase